MARRRSTPPPHPMDGGLRPWAMDARYRWHLRPFDDDLTRTAEGAVVHTVCGIRFPAAFINRAVPEGSMNVCPTCLATAKETAA